MLHSVIMAGGSGTRFWPASRARFPKQLLPIGTVRPLVEETLDRVLPLTPPERVLVVTNEAYAVRTAELLSELPRENVIGEPAGRDTAACIGLAALVLRARDPDAVMAVMPSDHIITPADAFRSALDAGCRVLEDHPGALVTYGVEPAFPATGYGYIQRGEEAARAGGLSFYRVRAFEEKPPQDRAEAFLARGGYYWNAGIFLWRADTILELIARFLPDLHQGLERIRPALGGDRFTEALDREYPELQKISIDYGVMEKAEERLVAAVNFQWDDVGSWRALERLLPADEAGNHTEGACFQVDAAGNLVSARGGVVGLVGVEGLVVVHTPDATLVCRKEDAERVKALVERLAPEYR